MYAFLISSVQVNIKYSNYCKRIIICSEKDHLTYTYVNQNRLYRYAHKLFLVIDGNGQQEGGYIATQWPLVLSEERILFGPLVSDLYHLNVHLSTKNSFGKDSSNNKIFLNEEMPAVQI